MRNCPAVPKTPFALTPEFKLTLAPIVTFALKIALPLTVSGDEDDSVTEPLNVAVALTTRFAPLMSVRAEIRYVWALAITVFEADELTVRFAPNVDMPVRYIPVALAKNLSPATDKLLVVSTVFPIVNAPIGAPFAAVPTNSDPLLMRSIMVLVRVSQSRKVFVVASVEMGSVGVGIGNSI